MDCQTFVTSLHRFSTFSLHILLSLFSDRMAMNVLNNQILSVKNLLANVGDVRDVGSIPGSRRSPGEGHGNPLQFSCLENLMARGAWRATVYGVARSQTRLKCLSIQNTCIYTPEQGRRESWWRQKTKRQEDLRQNKGRERGRPEAQRRKCME